MASPGTTISFLAVVLSLHVPLHDQLHLEADTADFALAGEPSVY